VAVAKARLTQAQQRVELNVARAELLRERVNDMRIAAPFKGVIVTRHVEVGEWLGEGDAVVEIVSAGPVEIWLNVPQRQLDALLSARRSVTVSIDATEELHELSELRIIPQVDPRARNFRLVATLPNEDQRLAPGMSAMAWVPTGEMSDQLVISKDAVLRNEAGPYVYVARVQPDSGSVAVPTPVTVLFAAGVHVAVRAGGLQEGDLVIVEGNERLFPMMPVRPVRSTSRGEQEAPR
jgi:membrane fusion protein (multidrug efflux system)